jgi:hypothetical protein
MSKQLLFVAVILFAQLASAQEIYRWQDERGQWHYSDFLPPGVTAEKFLIADTTQKSLSPSPVIIDNEPKEAEDSRDHSTQASSDVDRLRSDSRRLLVFPPSDPGKPFPEWIPVDSFASIAECRKARALQMAASMVMDTYDIRLSKSRCISLVEFKPSKHANVIVAATSLEPDPGGFSTWVLYGRVFNGGQTTARNVVVRYRIRDARGIIYATGEILPTQRDISPLMFAEYRGQIVGAAGGSDRWVEAEAKWSKD